LIDELRSRTGLLLAVASIAASFLGREAFAGDPRPALVVLALVSFLGAIGASVYVLLPKDEHFVFALVGTRTYENLYGLRDNLPEVYRRLAYQLDRFWDGNDVELQELVKGFRWSALSLAVEIVVLAAMVSDTLL
jgi:hypothetical protein